jgi:hypothetical protein
MTDPRRCKCECDGAFHGGSAGSYTVIPRATWRPEEPALRTLGWLIEHPDVAQAIAQRIMAVRDGVVRSWPEKDRRKLYGGFRRTSHLLCGLLAVLACELAELLKSSDVIGEAVADELVNRSRSRLKGPRVRLAHAMTKVMTSRVVAAVTAQDELSALLRLMRVAALGICPNVRRHRVVRLCCEAPIENELITTQIAAELKDIAGAL